MKAKQYIVELEPETWIADVPGDPGRTVVIDHALRFPTKTMALEAMAYARRFRAFRAAKIVRAP